MLRDDTSYAEFMESQQAELIDIRTLVNAIAATAAALLCLGYVVRAYRSLVPRFCSAEQQDQLAYRAILDQLASVGMTRRYGESREHFAARAANTFYDSICYCVPPVMLLGAARQSAVLTGTDSSALWRRKLAKTCLPAAGPAFINPYSWTFTAEHRLSDDLQLFWLTRQNCLQTLRLITQTTVPASSRRSESAKAISVLRAGRLSQKQVLGRDDVIDLAVIALVAGGHVRLEDFLDLKPRQGLGEAIKSEARKSKLLPHSEGYNLHLTCCPQTSPVRLF